MAKTKLWVGAVVVAAAAVGGYWYWSPHLALRTMHQAAMAKDAETLNEHVDYPRLRESMKGQMMAMMTEAMKPKAGDSAGAQAGAALGAMLGQAMVNGMVDAMVRPEFVMKAMQEGKLQAVKPGAAASAPTPPKEPKWTSERRGADKFFVWTIPEAGEGPEKRFGLVLERSGFANWKLTEVRLPAL